MYLLLLGHIGKTKKVVTNTSKARQNLCERCDNEVLSMTVTKDKQHLLLKRSIVVIQGDTNALEYVSEGTGIKTVDDGTSLKNL